jgi:PPOX class probable F420-dependent enzyme
MPVMTTSERDAFLAEHGVLLKIATVRPDGAPLVTPIWFLYEEDRIWFTPRAASEWLTHIRADPRVALSIDEQPLPYRKVLIEGTAQLIHDTGEDDAWRDCYRRIAQRYVPPEAAEAYIQETLDQPRALLAVALAGSRVRTWRMPLGDEPGAGIWHRRYYAPGSKLAKG